MLKNPKLSPTKAALEVYDVKSKHTAEVIASENMSKPEILKYLNEYDSEAQQTVISVMKRASKKQSSAFQRLAYDSANSVLDRIHGKATVRAETTNTNLNLNVEASTEVAEAFTAFIKGHTTQD